MYHNPSLQLQSYSALQDDERALDEPFLWPCLGHNPEHHPSVGLKSNRRVSTNGQDE